MNKFPEAPTSSSTFPFSTNSRIPEDTVFYAIFPDVSLNNPSSSSSSSKTLTKPQDESDLSSSLHSLHLQILNTISPYTNEYIWQHEPFTLSLSSSSNPNCSCSTEIQHFHGKTKYGDNLEDEWFIVFLLFEISRKIPNVSIRVWDTDGEFLLIEAAFSLPRWLNPETSLNRVFIRKGELNIVPKEKFSSNPKLFDALNFIVSHGEEVRAPNTVQSAVKNRISGYPERARLNMHQVRVRVPISVAKVLKHEPCLISLAVEAFYDRDIDSMKSASKMEKFVSGGTSEEFVQVSVRMSRAMYAQLVQQTFQAPKCYPMPPRMDSSVYVEAELGMKIACGFEMMYQQRRHERSEVKGSTWDAFKESLESSGYFKDLIPGSNEYRRLMANAQEYYRNSSLFSRASEMMNAPVRRIDEILALPDSAEEFKGVDLPPSDDDAWLYNGEDELKSAMLEREKEMENYELKREKSQKAKGKKGIDPSADTKFGDSDLGNIVKSMQSFVHKVSSFEGAEVPKNRDSNPVDLDVDRFMKEMESVMGKLGQDDADLDEGSSSEMEYDDSEDESDFAEDGDEDREDNFMDTYSDALNEELKSTSLKKSFVRANEQSSGKENQGASTSNAGVDMEDDEFTPVDVDVNLVKSLLDSFSSQQGLPGPASNLLGLMGLKLPEDSATKQDKK